MFDTRKSCGCFKGTYCMHGGPDMDKFPDGSHVITFHESETTYTIKILESQRQLLILACAVLAIQSPGMEYALLEIVMQIDNPGCPMFDSLKRSRDTRDPLDAIVEDVTNEPIRSGYTDQSHLGVSAMFDNSPC